MSNILRKVRRNQLKKELNTNKIQDAYHDRYDTIEQKVKRSIKNAKNN